MCDDGFGDYEADAICREIGFDGSTTWRSGEFIGPEDTVDGRDGREMYNAYISLPITLDDVSCPHNEWDDCTFRRRHNCGHSEDVQLMCRGIQ